MLKLELQQQTLELELLKLERSTDSTDTNKNLINVDRLHVLDGGFRGFTRSKFDPNRGLDVRFVDEDGIDAGGPTREFLRLTLKELRDCPIFEGLPDGKMLALDYNWYKKNLYFVAGKIIAYSIVHRGPFPQFFSPVLFSMIALGTESVKPTPSTIVDYELREKVTKLAEASTEDDFRYQCNVLDDVIGLAGMNHMVVHFSEDRRDWMVDGLCRFIIIDRLRNALEQFLSGLSTLNVLQSIQDNPDMWKEVFVFSSKTLSPTTIDELFTIKWSEEGSNNRVNERRIISYWRDLLQDLDEGILEEETVLFLKDLLVFATGVDQIHPLGFDIKPSISFNFGQDNPFLHGLPIANTCTLELKLPVVESYDTFKTRMVNSLLMVSTFTSH